MNEPTIIKQFKDQVEMKAFIEDAKRMAKVKKRYPPARFDLQLKIKDMNIQVTRRTKKK